MKLKKLLSIIFISLLVISCSSAPISGRKQLLLVDEAPLIQQSYTQYRQVLNQSVVLNNNDAKMVKKVGNNIAKAVERYFQLHPEERRSNIKYAWEFNLLKDKTPNAWCMPGGKVAVYTGILPYTQNEQGLAVVMSHEIAHAIAQHSREQQSQSMIQSGVGALLGVAFGVPQELYGSASNLIMLNYSRTQETEADELGLIFMKMAGYNPNYALTFWQRMAKASGENQSPEFLSTHPNDQTRINNIKRFLQSEKFKNISK